MGRDAPATARHGGRAYRRADRFSQRERLVPGQATAANYNTDRQYWLNNGLGGPSEQNYLRVYNQLFNIRKKEGKLTASQQALFNKAEAALGQDLFFADDAFQREPLTGRGKTSGGKFPLWKTGATNGRRRMMN